MNDAQTPERRRNMTEEHIPVRLSHLLRDCSVGAVVRGPDGLMVVQDTRFWDRPGSDPLDRQIRHVERVRSALGIEQLLCEAPRAVKFGEAMTGWIPALRFPTWMRCLACGLLHPAPWRQRPSRNEDGSLPAASSAPKPEICGCGGPLEQTPWVLVHEDGYLADVPWHHLTHAESRNPDQMACEHDRSKPYLILEENEPGRRLRCTRCGAQAGFSTSKGSRHPFPGGEWQQPWVREPPAERPSEPAWLVEINDVRVHTPITRTVLVIPPESRIRHGTVTDRLYCDKGNQRRVRSARGGLARKSAVRRLASEYRCAPADIEKALREIDKGYPLYGGSIAVTDLPADEYRALTGEIPGLREDEDLVTEHHTRDWKRLARALKPGTARRVVDAVSGLVAVNRLKAIMALIGFRRAGGEQVIPPDITGETGWLPALALFGEGIFFTLDEAMLREWENHEAIRARTEEFARRCHERSEPWSPDREIEVTPRFLLCHTLAHLVIRELDAGAGYPAASLKERIYCAAGDKPMAGILIYVAVPDEEGSLGGLMELAKPQRFLRLLTRAFESAAWCSLDPVCGEQDGHGPDLLNRAACHACALLPETSCIYENVLLDRVFVNGDGADIPAFLDTAGNCG